MRVGAIDCGTNSLRLLVVDVADGTAVDTMALGAAAGGAARELVRRSEIVRLGEGVDGTGRLASAALARVRAQSLDYIRQCVDLDVEHVVFAATSATRDAANAADLHDVVEEVLTPWGGGLTVLTGAQEAALTFAGAVGAVRVPPASVAEGKAADQCAVEREAVQRYAVVDLGGGSTEIAVGSCELESACSLDVGAVRLHERLRPADPPTRTDIAAVEAELADAWTDAVAMDGVDTLIGVAGTATTAAAVELGLDAYDRVAVHLHRSTPDAVARAARRLAAMPVRDRAALGFMAPGRADVIGVGALLWAGILERAAAAGVREVVISEHDLLDALVTLRPASRR